MLNPVFKLSLSSYNFKKFAIKVAKNFYVLSYYNYDMWSEKFCCKQNKNVVKTFSF